MGMDFNKMFENLNSTYVVLFLIIGIVLCYLTIQPRTNKKKNKMSDGRRKSNKQLQSRFRHKHRKDI